MTVITEPRVQDSIGTALHFVRSNWRNIVLVSVIAAIANTVIQMVGGLAPGLPLITMIFVLMLYAVIYALFVSLALRGAPVAFNWNEGLKLFGAMAIIAFFLGIVFFVLAMVVGIALLGGPYAPYMQRVAQASGDQSAVNQLLIRMWTENPWPIVVAGGFYVLVWFYLTTRLYLAAPATLDRGRILTFETWSWTKHAALKVASARIILIGPAFVLTFALTYLLGRAVGIDLFNPQAAAPQPVGALVYAIVSGFLSYAISDSLGAGLSTALYRDLGGQNAKLPPR